jgi:hypothetical protein
VDLFKDKFNPNKYKNEKMFDLIEQVTVKNQKCWYTTLRQPGNFNNTNTINEYILSCQKSLPPSKSADIITSLRINDDEQSQVRQDCASLQQVQLPRDQYGNSSYLISQTMHTMEQLNAVGAAYLPQTNIRKLNNLPAELEPLNSLPRIQQQQQPQQTSPYQHSLPIYTGYGRDDNKKKKMKNKRRNK